VLRWDHVGRDGADARYAREMEVYLGMCRRWREIPKPSVAMRSGMDSVFGLHHVAHAHNAEVSGHSLAGLDARAMRDPM